MRAQLTILLTILSLLTIGQSTPCDTIYLNDGKIIVANIKSETAYAYNYFLCCNDCAVERQVDKKDVIKLSLSPINKEKISNLDEENCDFLLLLGGSKLYVEILSESKHSFKYKYCCNECSEISKIKKTDIAYSSFTKTTRLSLQKQKDELDLHHPFSINLEIGGPLGFGGLAFEYFPFKRFGLKIVAVLPMSGGIVGNSSILFKLGKKKRFIPSIGFSNAFGIGSDSIFLTNFFSFHKPTRFGYYRISPGILIAGGDIAPALPWLGVSLGFNLLNKKKG